MTESRTKTGLQSLGMSRVGLGTWPFSGAGWDMGWGPQDDATSVATIHRAVELGANWIDTAATYGIGHSEEVVGRALAEMSLDDRPYVITKCGVVRDKNQPYGKPQRILTPASIRAEVEGSLQRLGVDALDVLLFHFPDERDTPVEDSWGEVGRLIEEGKVRMGGLSNHPVSLLAQHHELRSIDVVQAGLSLVKRPDLLDTIPWCVDNGIPVIAFSTLRSGLLTDGFSKRDVMAFDESDWRRNHPDFNSPLLERHLAVRDSLIPIAERHEVSVAAVAIAWALAWPGVIGTIIGARAPTEIDAWITVLELQLDDADLDHIDKSLRTNGMDDAPTRPLRA